MSTHLRQPECQRRAVVLIHGIGEQQPLSTLLTFVEGVVGGIHSPSAPAGRIQRKSNFTHPAAGEYFLRFQAADGPITDFYEYYWAPYTAQTRWRSLARWVLSVMLQNPAPQPRDVRMYFWIAWLIGIAQFCLLSGALLSLLWPLPALVLLRLPACVAVLMTMLATRLIVLPVLGDAASYLRPAPATAMAGRAIRRQGRALLRALNRSPAVGDVVLIGHSLGSVIAYDCLCQVWDEQIRARNQREPSWKVSQLITLGSPLTHAALLLTANGLSWSDMCRLGFAGEPSQTDRGLFKTVTWYNLYDPVRWLVLGDPVGGPIAPHFGGFVRDTPGRMTPPLFTHCRYWLRTDPRNPHRRTLRRLLGLSTGDQDTRSSS